MSWFLQALRKYAVFEGRSQRKEYWYFVLFLFLISIVLTALDTLFGTYTQRYQLGLLTSIFSVATFVPWVALSVRRLHDIGYSGRWLWTLLLPAVVMGANLVLGFVMVIVLSIVFTVAAMVDGEPNPNKYGPSPKAITPQGATTS